MTCTPARRGVASADGRRLAGRDEIARVAAAGTSTIATPVVVDRAVAARRARAGRPRPLRDGVRVPSVGFRAALTGVTYRRRGRWSSSRPGHRAACRSSALLGAATSTGRSRARRLARSADWPTRHASSVLANVVAGTLGAFRVRDDGRAAQRRQVVARQRHLRGEGQHRLGQAADHPPPGARRAQPARRPARVRRHARPAQAGDGARAQGQRHGDRERGRVRRRRRRRLPGARRHGAVRRRRPLGRRSPRPAAQRRRRQQDRPGQPRSRCWPSSRRPASSAPRPTSRCRPAPATASTPSSSTSSARCPEGPAFFPDDTVRDVPEEQWVAELVREQLLAVTRDELPYSIATRVSEWEGNRITVEIIVERESQKGMVIGRGGQVLKQVGERARAPAARGDVPRPAGEGRQGLAAPARPRRSPVLRQRQRGMGRCASSRSSRRPPRPVRPRPRRRGGRCATFEATSRRWRADERIVSTSALPEGLSPAEIDVVVKQRMASGEDLYHLDRDAFADARPDDGRDQDLCAVCAVDVSEVDDAHRLPRLPRRRADARPDDARRGHRLGADGRGGDGDERPCRRDRRRSCRVPAGRRSPTPSTAPTASPDAGAGVDRPGLHAPVTGCPTSRRAAGGEPVLGRPRREVGRCRLVGRWPSCGAEVGDRGAVRRTASMAPPIWPSRSSPPACCADRRGVGRRRRCVHRAPRSRGWSTVSRRSPRSCIRTMWRTRCRRRSSHHDHRLAM